MKLKHWPVSIRQGSEQLTVLVILLSALLLLTQTAARAQQLDVPYVPTPQQVVDRMLELAQVKETDRVYDLGSGDGRIVITAARKYGANGVGIDLDPERVAEARMKAEEAGVKEKVEFRVSDLFEADLSEADVVTLYLLPRINEKLRPQLWRQLRVGTRVVSHAFDMGREWPPEQTETVAGSNIYYWTIREEHKQRLALN